jgi:hypothetical protein
MPTSSSTFVPHTMTVAQVTKTMKYAYQELPHPENALFPCSQKVEQKESMFDLYIK